MVHPAATGSAERGERKHMWFVPPSPWQRKMHVKLGTGYRLKSSGRSAKPVGAKKEHMVVVCGSDTSRKITLTRAPEHLTAMGTGPAPSPSLT